MNFILKTKRIAARTKWTEIPEEVNDIMNELASNQNTYQLLNEETSSCDVLSSRLKTLGVNQ